MLLLLHEPEQMHFGIIGYLFTGICINPHRVVHFISALLRDRTGNNMHPVTSCKLGDPLPALPPLHIRQLMNLLQRITCIPHFGQYEQIRLNISLQRLLHPALHDLPVSSGPSHMNITLDHGNIP
ncbi:hypothetical protein D3C77_396990 [compost metagenome]